MSGPCERFLDQTMLIVGSSLCKVPILATGERWMSNLLLEKSRISKGSAYTSFMRFGSRHVGLRCFEACRVTQNLVVLKLADAEILRTKIL